MPDIVIRNIEDSLAERIKSIARERKWSINDVILHVLRQGLGLTTGDEVAHRDVHDIATLGGTWDPREAAAFRSAVEAFERIEGTPLFSPGQARDGQRPK